MFGGTGFLGLGGTGFGDFVEKAGSTIGEVVNTGAEFIARAPNELIELGQQLGGRVFNQDGETQQTFIEEGRRFESGRIGGNIGQSINDNIGVIGLVVGIIALVALLSGK